MRCIIVDDDELSRSIIKDLTDETNDLELVALCASAIEAANFLRKESVDLIFLDMEMPKVSGLEFLASLTVKPQVIIVSSNKDYALQSYEFDITDYILKPITPARFQKAVGRAFEVYDKQSGKNKSNRDEIFVKVDSMLVKINLKDICYIEALGNYLTIHTAEKKYTIHSTMKEIEDKLPVEDFIRVHRSYIVRIDKISRIQDNLIDINKQLITVGASYKEALMRSLNLS